MTTRHPLSVQLAGQVWGVAAWDAGSPIVTTAVDGDDLHTTVVCAVDLAGKVLWHQRFQRRGFEPFRGYDLPSPLRLSGDRTAWIAHRGARDVEVSELDSAGKTVSTIRLECDPVEMLGTFVLLPDGFMVLWMPAGQGRVLPRTRWGHLRRWLPTERGRATPRHRHARLARHDHDGSTRWEVPLPLRNISFPGCVYMGRATGGRIEPQPPWTPHILEACRPTALLVSGSRAAATVVCGRSGISVTFFVDTDTGQIVGKTAPGPTREQAIAGRGKFLIGTQGYGAFRTARYDAAGVLTQEWPTHAQMLVDAQGVISGPESQNTSAPQCFVRFGIDGTVQRGSALSGYYTAYPALDHHGTAVFWRDGFLWAADTDLEKRALFKFGHDGREVVGRVLLQEEGQVVFSVSDELIIYREPELGPLSDGVWPCADGGLRGNPVSFFPSA